MPHEISIYIMSEIHYLLLSTWTSIYIISEIYYLYLRLLSLFKKLFVSFLFPLLSFKLQLPPLSFCHVPANLMPVLLSGSLCSVFWVSDLEAPVSSQGLSFEGALAQTLLASGGSCHVTLHIEQHPVRPGFLSPPFSELSLWASDKVLGSWILVTPRDFLSGI